MPQIVFEVPEEAKFTTETKELLSKINFAVAEAGDIPVENCKSRLTTHEHFFIGGDNNGLCLNLSVAILEGKDVETKKKIAEAAAEIIKGFYIVDESKKTQITVNVTELSKQIYTKVIV